ncbi:MAG: peptidoglycan DD-metalloendopeptidase family protein, partial [Gemmataceae bacterium]
MTRRRYFSFGSGFETLEDRSTPANLTMVNARLVDASNNLQANPVFGQNVFLRAEWNSSAMAGGEVCNVRYTVNGVPAESGNVTHSAGNGGWFWWRGGWYVGTAAVSVTVMVDPNNLIAETNENDNAITFILTPVAPIGLPATKFIQPVGLTPNKDWSITNYADIDPRTNIRSDYQGGPYQYDGHDAIDAGPINFRMQDRGVPIVAAADGVVDNIAGGNNFDRETSWNGGQNWNAVRINHGNSWQTSYGHLAAGSITVKVGDTVRQGQVIGFMGSSGISTGTHIHYNAFYRGAQVEAYFSPSSYWINPMPYAPTVPSFYFNGGTGVTTADLFGTDLGEGIPQHTVLPTTGNASANVFFYIQGYNLKTTDQMTWRWIRPNGSIFQTSTFSPNQNYFYSYWYWTHQLGTFQNTPGDWQIAYILNGVEQSRHTFTVASGNGSAALRVAGPGNTPLLDNRTTPINLGTVAQNATAPTYSMTLANFGHVPLTISNYRLPAGFSLVSGPTSINPASNAAFTIRMDTAVVGTKYGSLRFDTNAPDTGTYELPFSGVIDGSPLGSVPTLTANVNQALLYNYNAVQRPLFPTGTLSALNNNALFGGTLTAEWATFGRSTDQLLIDPLTGPGFGVTTNGTNVVVNGTTMGTFT